jgi:hypothetical protein
MFTAYLICGFFFICRIYTQITTILIGMGASASLLVAFTVLAGCCLSDVITRSTAKALGVIQLIGG